MFWGFLILSALGLTFVKLGSYSIWVVVFSTALKMALVVIAVLAALLIWTKVIKKKERPCHRHQPKEYLMKPTTWIGAMIMLGLLADCGGSGGGVAASPSVRLIVSNTLRTFISGSEYFSQTAQEPKTPTAILRQDGLPSPHPALYQPSSVEALNNYLCMMANQQPNKDNSRTFVLEDESKPKYIIGFHSLCTSSQ